MSTKRTQKPTCGGTGKLPRVVIQNDWWVGVKGVCPDCGRSVNIKNGVIVRHVKRGFREPAKQE